MKQTMCIYVQRCCERCVAWVRTIGLGNGVGQSLKVRKLGLGSWLVDCKLGHASF